MCFCFAYEKLNKQNAAAAFALDVKRQYTTTKRLQIFHKPNKAMLMENNQVYIYETNCITQPTKFTTNNRACKSPCMPNKSGKQDRNEEMAQADIKKL